MILAITNTFRQKTLFYTHSFIAFVDAINISLEGICLIFSDFQLNTFSQVTIIVTTTS